MMIAIVDGGSTKADWILIKTKESKTQFNFKTKGLNPAIINAKAIDFTLNNSPDLSKHKNAITQLFYYGAGCGTEKPRELLKSRLEKFFKQAKVRVKEDTYAAVYATTPHAPGVVCILGTGSNCVFFNDKGKIEQKVKSLGYSIMDDASGNYFGRQLLRDYFFEKMPKHLVEKFNAAHNLDPDFIKNKLYKQEFPNAYLAQFAAFLFDNYTEAYTKRVLKRGFALFAETMLSSYSSKLTTHPVHFVGSIAALAETELQATAKTYNFKIGSVVKYPIKELVNYQLNKAT